MLGDLYAMQEIKPIGPLVRQATQPILPLDINVGFSKTNFGYSVYSQ